MVELRGGYSNPQALETVALAAEAVGRIKAEERQVQLPIPPRRWRLVDRLGEQVIRQLLEDRRAGLTKRALVERYGISLSGVKRWHSDPEMVDRSIRLVLGRAMPARNQPNHTLPGHRRREFNGLIDWDRAQSMTA